MNKYHNGKIYKIVDVGYNKQYIGSTTESLSQRMARHRAVYKCYNDGVRKDRNSSFDLFDEYSPEKCKIELVEFCKCETKYELLRREGELIKASDCVNKNVAGRSNREWKADNKVKEQVYHKTYRENHPDRVLKQQNDYREAHRDVLREKGRQSYHNHTEKHKCECGSTCHKFKIKRHERSKKHQAYLQTLEPVD